MARFVNINNAELQRILRSQGGPVGQRLKLIGEKGLELAKRFAPKGHKPSTQPPPLHKTLELKIFQSSTEGTVVLVGSKHPKMSWVHDGTPRHIIVPRNPRKPLVFFWDRVGRTVYLHRVNHPGIAQRPRPGNIGVQPFLVDVQNAIIRLVRGR